MEPRRWNTTVRPPSPVLFVPRLFPLLKFCRTVYAAERVLFLLILTPRLAFFSICFRSDKQSFLIKRHVDTFLNVRSNRRNCNSAFTFLPRASFDSLASISIPPRSISAERRRGSIGGETVRRANNKVIKRVSLPTRTAWRNQSASRLISPSPLGKIYISCHYFCRDSGGPGNK